MSVIAVIVLLLGLILFMAIGLPLGFSIFFISAIVTYLFTDLPFWLFMQKFYAGIGSFVLAAIPFFLLAGNLMNEGKITDRLLEVSNAFVGRFRGGLAQVNVLVSLLFGGISGSAVADTAGVGTVLIPSMRAKGYPLPFAVSLTASSSVLGQIIPPSLIMIIYSAASGTSVQAMFLAGVVPGILVALAMMFVTWLYARKYNFPRERKYSWKEKFITLGRASLTFLMPLIIIGGVISGLFTATESSVIAVVYSLILTLFVYRSLTMRQTLKVFISSAKSSANTLFCIGAANIFGYLLAYFKVNTLVTQLFNTLDVGAIGYLLIVLLLFLILGTFMDATPAIYIFVPLVIPFAENLALNPVHVGIIICLVLGFGLVTPPYGLCLLIASSIAKINAKEVFKDLFILLAAIMVVLLVLLLLPQLVLFLPRLLVPDFV